MLTLHAAYLPEFHMDSCALQGIIPESHPGVSPGHRQVWTPNKIKQTKMK